MKPVLHWRRGLSLICIIVSIASCSSNIVAGRPTDFTGGETLEFKIERTYAGGSFLLVIESNMPGDRIAYTLDCSNPATSRTALEGVSPLRVNVNPDQNPNGILPLVVVRARLAAPEYAEAPTETRSFLVFDEIIRLSPDETRPGPQWPQTEKNSWDRQNMDYGLDPTVYRNPAYEPLMDDAFRQLPVISLVTEYGNLFDLQNGIYANPEFHGREWERPVSVELIDGEAGFRIDAGLRIRGGWSRHKNYLKHGFRLFFRGGYGKTKLHYPLFGDEGTDVFDVVDLRTSQNYAWSNSEGNAQYDPSVHGIMLRDVFCRDLQRDMGRPYTRSRFYHLFLNGCYWGIYQTQERPQADYAATYFGGNPEDYDVIKVDIGRNWDLYEIEATDGDLRAWRAVYDLAQGGFEQNAAYFRLEGKNAQGGDDPGLPALVDIDNLIDYMIIIFYTGNFDSPISNPRANSVPNNYFAIYNREDPGKGFMFFIHDAEHTLLNEWEDRVSVPALNITRFEFFNPQTLHCALAKNALYRTRFSNRVKEVFFGDGPLTAEKNRKRLMARAAEIETAIIAESARWGDARREPPRTKADWQKAVDRIVTKYFPARGQIVLNQLKAAGLYKP